MKKVLKIKKIKAREILDSRANPTVEVRLETDNGFFVSSVPSGASTGKNEAVELRDGGKRYLGKGVLKAVENVNKIIGSKLKGMDVRRQKEIDKLMIELDGTPNKSKLGANAILPVSMAVCRAGAFAENLPLYKYITEIDKKVYKDRDLTESAETAFFQTQRKIPLACFNIINGGAHAGNKLDIQEFMIIPHLDSFAENLRQASEIYHNLEKILENDFGRQATNVGDEGGFAPFIFQASQALSLIEQALKNYPKTKIGLDCAASQFYRNGKYELENAVFTREGLLLFYNDLTEKYPIIFLEDPFDQEDWQGWKKIMSNKRKMSNISIVGDDFLTTNPERIKKAGEEKVCSGVIIKPNQIGTITEALEAAKLARQYGWKIIVSHRSGETSDDFIADFAVGVRADFIKSGAPARGERVVKYNRLLEIEEEINNNF